MAYIDPHDTNADPNEGRRMCIYIILGALFTQQPRTRGLFRTPEPRTEKTEEKFIISSETRKGAFDELRKRLSHIKNFHAFEISCVTVMEKDEPTRFSLASGADRLQPSNY